MVVSARSTTCIEGAEGADESIRSFGLPMSAVGKYVRGYWLIRRAKSDSAFRPRVEENREIVRCKVQPFR